MQVKATEDAAAVGSGGYARGVARWFVAAAQAVGVTYRRGFLLPVMAPAIFALAALPEAAQHVAEIQLGLFQSRASFMALAADPLRMGFGYVKIAGLLLCMLFAARYWSCDRSLRRTLLVPMHDIGRILLAVALNLAASLASERAGMLGLPYVLEVTVAVACSVFALLLLAYLVAALIGDRSLTLGRSLWRGWRLLPLLAILLVAAYGPAFLLHIGAHRLALGTGPVLLWTIMAVDALVVGLLACLTGSALYTAFERSGVATLPLPATAGASERAASLSGAAG